MVVLLLLMVGGIALTGWMQTTDAYWGVEWVEETHEALAELLLVAIAMHVVGVIHTSLRHHENLVLAMITGSNGRPLPAIFPDLPIPVKTNKDAAPAASLLLL